MKKSMATVAASTAVALTIGGVLYLGDAVGASPENEAKQDRAPFAAAAAPEIAAVPELSQVAVAGIEQEGLLIDVLSEAEAARTEGVVPRSEIVKNALAGARGEFDAPELTEVSLARVTVPDYGTSRDETDDPNKPLNLDLIIKDRLVWVVTAHMKNVPMPLGGPAPKTDEEALGREKSTAPVFDRASFAVLVDAATGEFLRAESITVADSK